jgi:hypothetical protein
MAGHVFISYASSDSQAALRICSAIEERGIRCWIAPRDVQPGSDYSAALFDAIGESVAVVLVLSANSNKSPHVKREVGRAAGKDITIVPFLIEKTELDKALEFNIGLRHWLDATNGPLQPHIRKLVETVERFASAQPANVTRPQPQDLLNQPRTKGPRWLYVAAAATAATVLSALVVLHEASHIGFCRPTLRWLIRTKSARDFLGVWAGRPTRLYPGPEDHGNFRLIAYPVSVAAGCVLAFAVDRFVLRKRGFHTRWRVILWTLLMAIGTAAMLLALGI